MVGFAEISAIVTLIHRSTFHPKKEQIAANIGSEEGGVMTITHAPLVPLKLSSQCAYLAGRGGGGRWGAALRSGQISTLPLS